MSIQWTIIATFLYVEIAVVLLLVLPVASPKRWQGIFRSRFLHSLSRQASLYFYVLLFVLVLFLLDAIREMRKYSSSSDAHDTHSHPHQLDLEMQVNISLKFLDPSWLPLLKIAPLEKQVWSSLFPSSAMWSNAEDWRSIPSHIQYWQEQQIINRL